MTTHTNDLGVLEGMPSSDELSLALEQAAEELAEGSSGTLLDRDRILLAVAGGTMTAGLALIALGWYGASRAVLVQEQVAYMISGGLGGLALAVIGSVTYFAYWQLVAIRESRAHNQALLSALAAHIDVSPEVNSATDARRTRRERPLRSTSGGH